VSTRFLSTVAVGTLALMAAVAGAASGDAPAATPSPQDFAYGMRFETQGVAAAFRLALPLEVYRGVALANLADVAVFNERNEVVPHVVEVPRTQSTVRQAPVSFPVFPIRGNERTALDAIRVTIEAGGTRVDLQAPSGGDGRSDSKHGAA